MKDFPEEDWKFMRALKSTLLERLCERINQATVRILDDPAKTAYERYLDVFVKMQKDDMEVANAFDDWRRSTLSTRIIEIFRQGLFTDSEIQGFTQQTRDHIDAHRPVKPKKT